MAVALRGNLKDFGIAEVFQLIGQQRKTGLLEISRGKSKVCLAFDEGSVVWATPVGSHEYEVLGQKLVRCGLLTQQMVANLIAESEASARSLPALIRSQQVLRGEDLEEISDLLTQETIFDVLRWESGSFDFSAQPVSHDRPPEKLLAAEQILMDGLRMVDEWQTFAGKVPSEDSVIERRGSLEELQTAQNRLRCSAEQAERIFQLVDGRLTLARIIDLSRLGLFDATRVCAELIGSELIAPRDAGPRSEDRGHRSGRSMAEQMRWIAAACFPLLALALLVAGMHEFGKRAATLRIAHPIERSAIAEVQASFAKRRLRNALEAHRYLKGDWPLVLTEPDRTGLLGTKTLTPPASPPYYYARRAGGVVLLSPER